MKRFIKKLIPQPLFRALQPVYHFALAGIGALIYRFPSRKMHIVGITGTKGKTTVVEMVNAILEESGKKTAIASTLRFKIGNDSRSNKFKMTMPGRMFLQKHFRKALEAGCSFVTLEMTSEGSKQFRHRFVNLNALIFTNLSKEHIESHGSYAKYLEAKVDIARQLHRGLKRKTVLVVNGDDEQKDAFVKVGADKVVLFGLKEVEYELYDKESLFVYQNIKFKLPMPGAFNIYNALASIKYAESQGIDLETCKRALEKFKGVPGRVEFVEDGQPFKLVVDYAHTTGSLDALLKTFPNDHIICVMGSAGGGRDKWKRPEMGEIADKYCDSIVLTNEDPYDEDPREIVEMIKKGIASTETEIIMDRRKAINKAIKKAFKLSASKKVAVLITGKGTDPFIMGPRGSKVPWDDVRVAREELRKLQQS